jgi:tetratricopeptide (TPR) repeat protein
VWFATGAPGGPERIRKKAEAFRTATRRGTNSVGVRWNYWRAAAGMTADRPLTGMGLDQYGTWYASYKPMEGWAVRRAHSLPLQLLADGGVLLLVGFVAAWGVILASGRRRDPLPPEPAAPDDASGSAPARQLYWAGLLAAGAAYLLLLSPVFDALGVEFVIRELWGGGATDWPVEKAPALIHLGAHALFMPGVAVAIWWAVWRATARSEGAPAALAAGLRLGLAGFLLHGLVDFTYYVQGLSGYAWALAGVFVCGTVRIDRRVGAVIESKRRRNIVLVGIGAALVAVFALAAVQGAPRGLWPVAHWDRALRVELARRLYYHAERSRDIDRALRLHEAILEDYPDDAESHRYAAMLCKRLLRRQYEAIRSGEGLPPDLAEKARESDLRLRRAAIHHARRAVRLHDGFAPMHAFYGRLLTELAGRDPAAMRVARDAFVRAHERHPHKPEYLRRAGAAEEALGRTGQALRLYRAALALDADPRLTDRTRAGLTEKERRLLEERVARLEAAIETDEATVGDPLPGGNADADGDGPAPEEESRP